MRALKAFMPSGLFTDLIILAGLGMVFLGLYINWPWLAFTVVGSVLVILGVVMIR